MKKIFQVPLDRSEVTHWEDSNRAWSADKNKYADRLCIPQNNYYCGPSIEEFVARIEHYLPKSSDIIVTSNRIMAHLDDEGYVHRFHYGIVQAREINLMGTNYASSLMELMMGLEVEFREEPYDEYLERLNEIAPMKITMASDYLSYGRYLHHNIQNSYTYNINTNALCKI